jgi:hypothetical protein
MGVSAKSAMQNLVKAFTSLIALETCQFPPGFSGNLLQMLDDNADGA